MLRPTLFISLLFTVGLTGCVATAPTAYAGKGGMTARKITPQAYLHHYENGFTGPDAMGWDPNLQFAWSRLAAAKTCSVPYAQEQAVSALVKKYGQETFVHELNGINFHHLQSKGVPGFCTPQRVAEVKALVPAM
ncbi:MAG: hypothetical protein V4739_15755, partial [Pseudomonadota bacterium]